MLSLKLLLTFCAILTVCYCDSIKKKKKHKYELYWHGFHYLTFLAFKIKAFLVLGSIFTIGLIAGKIFALIKLAEYMNKTPNNGHSEKNVYISHPQSVGDHPSIQSFSQSNPIYGNLNQDDSFPLGFSVDQPPPGAQISDPGGHFNGPSGYNSGTEGNYFHEPSEMYGRSYSIEKYTIYDYFKLFRRFIRRFNITDMAFNYMNLKSEECRKKFVCETDFNSKDNIILKSAFNMFSDENYTKYKISTNVKSLYGCNDLYPNCEEDT